jgi:hypothetical protein
MVESAILDSRCLPLPILCSIPLDLPIDELITWRQLAGDPRVSGALAECDATSGIAFRPNALQTKRCKRGIVERHRAFEIGDPE